MDHDRIIANIAKRNGVLLERHDPILLVSTMLDMHEADQMERDERIAAALSGINRPPPVLTDQQVDDIGARLARGCDSWSAGLVKAANRRHYGLLLASLFSTALVGALASWLAFGKPLHPDCAVTPSGGRLCGEWVVPDKTR